MLADKYNLGGMKSFVQTSLELDWPKSLEHWDIIDRRKTALLQEGVLLTSDYLPEPAAAVRLAKQYEIKSVLPAALYHLSRCEREKKKTPTAAPVATAAGPAQAGAAPPAQVAGTQPAQ